MKNIMSSLRNVQVENKSRMFNLSDVNSDFLKITYQKKKKTKYTWKHLKKLKETKNLKIIKFLNKDKSN